MSSATSPFQFPDALEPPEMQAIEPDLLEMFLLDDTPDTNSETHSQMGGQTRSPFTNQGLLLAPESVDGHQIENDGQVWARRNRKRNSKEGITSQDSDSSRYGKLYSN